MTIILRKECYKFFHTGILAKYSEKSKVFLYFFNWLKYNNQYLIFIYFNLYRILVAIQKLPEYIINRLKAWEVVEKPASIIKELVENSLDAHAKKITINIHDGGKKLIQVEDDGDGIELSDIELLLERYATSKIQNEEDLLNINSYGFRGEALASIAEVSKISVLSKTAYAEIGSKISKRWAEVIVTHQPLWLDHGTIVTIKDLFYNVPARLKFLKSAQTEYYYCYQQFIDTALFHYDKHFILKKNDKIIFDLAPHTTITQRINALFKKDISSNLTPVEYENDRMKLSGFVSDPNLRFGSWEYIKIFVNQRPITDKIIRRALLNAYARQIAPWEYPFALLMLDIKTKNVDVNVHPRKSEVKFIAPRDIYQIIFSNIQKSLGNNKIAHSTRSFDYPTTTTHNTTQNYQDTQNRPQATSFFQANQFSNNKSYLSNNQSFDQHTSQEKFSNNHLWEYQIVWQLRNSYILLQNNDAIFYIDQHALAERISFEQMKLNITNKTQLQSELLLQPITIEITQIQNSEEKIKQLNELWFDCALLGENKLVSYAVPNIFIQHKVDLNSLFNQILYLEEINFDHILDNIFATKACKWSIKAGQKLSYEQMSNLVKEWFEHIPGMFVCQHGRPFFIQTDKNHIDKLFDR